MPQERNPLSIDEIAQVAQQTTLRGGRHLPTIISQGNENTATLHIHPLAETHDGRADQMFAAGLLLAQEGMIGVLQQVFLISEGWMSSDAKGKTPHMRPSQDPQRQEVLMISQLNVINQTTDMRVFEMQRYKQQKLFQVEPMASLGDKETKDLSLEIPLLLAFVLGFLGIDSIING